MTVTAADQLRSQLDLVRAHEVGARADRDPEHVHQLRVAVRRMRAMTRSAKQLDRELRWFARSLGAVRDLDVQLDRLRGRVDAFEQADAAAAEPLLAALRAERVGARDRMIEVFDSVRYRELLDAVEGAVLDESSADVAGALTKTYRVVRTAVDRLGYDPPDDDLHELRVKVKRLRYAAELAEDRKALVKAAKDLQTLLGEHQDATVAEETVRRLLTGIDAPATAFVAGRLVQAEQECKRRCRTQVPDAIEAVRAAAPS